MVKLLMVADICLIAAVSRPTVEKWLYDPRVPEEDRLPSIRLGARVYVKESDFLAWLDKNSTRGKPRRRRSHRGDNGRFSNSPEK